MSVLNQRNMGLILDGIDRMTIGEIRELSKIIGREPWESIPKGERLKLGSEFKAEVLRGAIPHLIWVDTKTNNWGRSSIADTKLLCSS